MECVNKNSRPIEFIRHRRESGGYEKSNYEHEVGMVKLIKVIQSKG